MTKRNFAALVALICTPSVIRAQGLPDPATEMADLLSTYNKLDGFIVRYDQQINDQKIGILEHGIHSVSGWSFVRISARAPNGLITPVVEQWTTPDGALIERKNDKIEILEGAETLWKKLRPVAAELLDAPPPASHCEPRGHLMPDHILTMEINAIGIVPPDWHHDSNLLLARSEKEGLFSHPEMGRLLVDRTTGLMTQQAVERPDGVSLLVRTQLERNLKPEDFSRRLKLPLNEVKRVPYTRSSHSRKMLVALLRKLISAHETGKWQDPALLEDHLRLQEDAFVRHLANHSREQEPGQDDPFVRLVTRIVGFLAKRNEDNPLAIIQHPAFKKRILKKEAVQYRKALGKISNPEMIKHWMGAPIEGRPDQQERTKIVQDFFIRCYLRARMEHAADLLHQELKEHFEKKEKK